MEDLFTNRKPNERQAEFLDAITAQMIETAGLLAQLPTSRFRSLALTKLEECSMWAKKAVVFTVAVERTGAEGDAPAATDPTGGSGAG